MPFPRAETDEYTKWDEDMTGCGRPSPKKRMFGLGTPPHNLNQQKASKHFLVRYGFRSSDMGCLFLFGLEYLCLGCSVPTQDPWFHSVAIIGTKEPVGRRDVLHGRHPMHKRNGTYLGFNPVMLPTLLDDLVRPSCST